MPAVLPRSRKSVSIYSRSAPEFKQISVKYSALKKLRFRRVYYYLLFEFVWEGVGLALIRGWARIRINAVQCISDSIYEREGKSIIEYLKGR